MKLKYIALAFTIPAITVTINLFISNPVQAASVNPGAIGRILASVILHPTTIGITIAGIISVLAIVMWAGDKK